MSNTETVPLVSKGTALINISSVLGLQHGQNYIISIQVLLPMQFEDTRGHILDKPKSNPGVII
jgi:hypothetical protein